MQRGRREVILCPGPRYRSLILEATSSIVRCSRFDSFRCSATGVLVQRFDLGSMRAKLLIRNAAVVDSGVDSQGPSFSSCLLTTCQIADGTANTKRMKDRWTPILFLTSLSCRAELYAFPTLDVLIGCGHLTDPSSTR